MRLKVIFTLTILLCTILVQGQVLDKVKRFYAFPFPVIYYAPETRFVFGVAGSATFRFPKDSLNTKPSNVFVGAAYTQNKQVLLYTQFQTFYDNNNYYVYGEAGYYVYSYFFFLPRHPRCA